MEGSSSGVRKGAWSKFEDELLKACVHLHGEGKWYLVPQRAGLNRCQKSCRLRWLNYLKPNIKRGDFSEDEIDLMIRLHKLLGNRWSLIAGRLPGRTSNDVKNYWNTYTRRKLHSQNRVKQSTSKTCPNLLQGEFINTSKVGVSKEGAAASSNWWETLCDENITVNNTCFFGEEDAVFDELWNQQLTSIDSHFLTEAETWSQIFLDLEIN
uniref:Uncharacterized protein n=2 Tax=Phaseolus vulgaris TaxID=3885 RepID=V7B0V2_PHAVU|nr:hypothetical protein PHAVU_008G038400g [Phaseolus vulgaris]ESW11532.1 hypothetical protein PHAVU_008G038400g [Phaseolus vulgaris]